MSIESLLGPGEDDGRGVVQSPTLSKLAFSQAIMNGASLLLPWPSNAP